MTNVKTSSFRAAMLSFFLVVALLFSSVTAYADFRPDLSFSSDFSSSFAAISPVGALEIAAGVAGSLEAIGIDLAFSAGTAYILDSLAQQIPGSVYIPLYSDQSFYEYLTVSGDAPTIKLKGDTTIIDGVEYQDVWLSHDAASKFRTSALDFVTNYNILSHSAGTYASGVGFFDGFPVYEVNGTPRTQASLHHSSTPYIGGWSFDQVDLPNTDNTSCRLYYNSVVKRTVSSGVTPRRWWVEFGSSGSRGCFQSSNPVYPYNEVYRAGWESESYTPEPFEFTWTSGEIQDEPISDDIGLTFRVPFSLISSLPSVVTPDLSTYADLLSTVGSALKDAYESQHLQRVAFEEYDSPAPPVPSTGTIAEEPYTSLDGSLSGIQDSLDNIDTNIGTVDESLDDIQVYAKDSADSLQSIDSNLSQSVADTAGIKGFVQQYLPGVHSFLSSISSSVSNIAGSIASADSTFFGNVVDAILAPFTPIFDIFKSGVGIWRYVVAWVGNISAPFSWIWSILSQANGILVSPILASAAAAVVLAVYKRFGR